MSNFSTNLQFNIAQLASLSKEQEKLKSASKNQQNAMENKITQTREDIHESVTAVQEEQQSNTIHKEFEHEQNQESSTDERPQSPSKEESTDDVIFKDEKKGNIVDFSC